MYKCLSRNSHAYEDVQTRSASRDGRYWGFVDVDLSTIENNAVRLNITIPSRAALEHIAAEHTNEVLPKVRCGCSWNGLVSPQP